jgi:hypothetical protein
MIVEGDWVLICETNDRGVVQTVYDEGERFMVIVQGTSKWPHPKRVHVMVEKIRKINPPKPSKEESKWNQISLL